MTRTTAFHVPFPNVDLENGALIPEILPRLETLLGRGEFIGGREVAAFEERMAELHGVSHAVSVNSGTDALRLTLRALKIPAGGEGITVANTFVATVAALLGEGIRPRLVDVGADENMTLAALEEAIGPDTRVVVAVHLRGLPCAIGPIRELCERHGVPLVEDCAQAVTARVAGRPVGSFGVAGCFSLHPVKNLGACGDAGVVVTDDAGLAEELRLLRNHGLRSREEVALFGENSRLDAFQAAVLNVKLTHLAAWTERRREQAAHYDERLRGLPLVLPPVGEERGHVFHRYTVQYERRDDLRAHLERAGIQTAVHYPVPIHLQPAAASAPLVVPEEGLPVTERQARRIVSLPLHPALNTAQIARVADEIAAFCTA